MIRNLVAPIALVLIALALPASAAEVTLPTTLNSLVDDPGDPNDDADAFFVSPSGRFRFSNFEFSPIGTTPPLDSNIFVTITESATNVDMVLEIQANGTATGPGAYELALEYLAEALDPNSAFVSHTLAMEGTTQGNGSIFINEVILAPGGGDIGAVSTTANVPNRPDVFSDTIQFAPTRTMTIHNKDIAVSGGATGADSASLLRVEQSFQVIPEPSTTALLALGLLGLGMTSRRFRSHH